MNSTAMLAPNASPVTSAVRRNCRQGARSSAANCAARAASMPNAATVRMAPTASAAVWLARSAALLTWRGARARVARRRGRSRRAQQAPRSAQPLRTRASRCCLMLRAEARTQATAASLSLHARCGGVHRRAVLVLARPGASHRWPARRKAGAPGGSAGRLCAPAR